MSTAHGYKKIEDNLAHKVKDTTGVVGRGITGAFRAFGRFLTRRYTVVFVPHSEKKVYNFHITVLSMFCFILVIAGIAGVSVWNGLNNNELRNNTIGKEKRLKEIQASLDQLRDETAMLNRVARGFEDALLNTLSIVGSDTGERAPASGGDLGSIFNIRETPEGQLQEVDDIRRIAVNLNSAIEPLGQIHKAVESLGIIMTEIPSIWPIKGGLGHISMYFGQNINPFSGQYYIHRGIDLSTYRSGDPVVASADGQVVNVAYTEEFGNYITISHKHGYYTRYAHLLYARARVGQRVQQGDVIGYIGNTGLSTGPHLHYEIHVGSDVVDPYKYINIRSRSDQQGR